MKVFLTGASGFVGSHILDFLRERHINVSLLLRKTSDTRFIARHLPEVDICYGSLSDPQALANAMQGSDGVIHCAGKTKALRLAEYYQVNHSGTRNVVVAVNACRKTVQHLVHISSLAVSGPGVLDKPACETDPPSPVSVYGKSKLQGEGDVMQYSRVPWTILRPAAVYGPRDVDFLSVFMTLKRGIMPLFAKGRNALSLIHVKDVAKAVLDTLGRAEAFGKIYHVAAAPPYTNAELLGIMAEQMGIRPLHVNIPRLVLYPLCWVQELISQLTGRPNILNRQKVAEILAPGWVCNVDRITHDLGFVAATSLRDGVRQTLDWYRRKEWL
jgi:nucleoside-diphosphate-sugar epimerase